MDRRTFLKGTGVSLTLLVMRPGKRPSRYVDVYVNLY